MKKIVALAGVGAVIIGLLAAGITLTSSTAQPQDLAANVSDQSTNRQSRAIPTNAFVLDVRTPEEFASGHAEIAKNLPLQDIESGTLPEVDKNQKIYLYCRSGNRSAQAVSLLKEAGFTNIEDLGGLEDARQAGLAFTQ